MAGQVCQRWKIPKAAQGGKGRGGGQRVNWIGSVLFCAKNILSFFVVDLK